MSTIKISESFYKNTFVVSKNKVTVGTFRPSKVFNPYESDLCFEIGNNRFTSEDLRVIADLLDLNNKNLFQSEEDNV
jgi:hypothetical protein